jgi:hypothetical protein
MLAMSGQCIVALTNQKNVLTVPVTASGKAARVKQKKNENNRNQIDGNMK